MGNILKVVFVICFISQVNALFAVDIRVNRRVESEFPGGDYGNIWVGGKAKINGDVSAEVVSLFNGGTLIVYGDLTITDSFMSNSVIAGNLIVTGDLKIEGDTDNRIFSNGVLVVGGSYDFGNGTELNTGNVFLSDPDDGGGFGGRGGVGDIDDLIDSGILPDDVLEDFLDNIDGDNLPNYSWLGNTDTLWDKVTNWSGNEIPGRVNNVTISSTATNFPLGCSGSKIYLMWNLTLEPNTEFTIPEGSNVTVYGDITIPPSSKLIIENSAANPTSFINRGSIIDGQGGTGEVTIKWDYDTERYWYIAHSISNPNISSYDVNTYGLFKYEYGWKDITGLNDFGDPLVGYALKIIGASSNTISHTGEFNNTDYEKDLMSGFQLIANPYASYYELAEEDITSGDFRYTTGSVYVRTGAVSRSFETFNTLTNISSPATFNGIIAPGQCFWVQRDENNSGGTKKVYMSLDKRIHDSSSLKSASSQKRGDNYKNLVRVNLENENGVDEAVVAFRDYGLYENSRFDSKQRYITKSDLSYIYSLKENNDNVISVFPDEFTDLSIPLGIKAKEGIHTISLNGLNQIDPSFSIVLEDLYEGISINLRENNGYSFDSSAGDINDRFRLNFTQISTDVEGQKEIKDKVSEEVLIYSEGNRIIVKLNENYNEIKEVMVYNLDGTKVLYNQFIGDTFTTEPIANKGFYMVKILGKSKESVKKIYIR